MPQRTALNIAVIDILMPQMSGLEVQTRLRRVSLDTGHVLTAKDDRQFVDGDQRRRFCFFHQRRGELWTFSPESKAAAIPANSFAQHVSG